MEEEEIDTKQQSLRRFESRFGNIEEFKKKVKEEHLKNCDHSDHCLECALAGVPQRPMRNEELIP